MLTASKTMQIPKRRGQGVNKFGQRDEHLTADAVARLKRTLERLEREERPRAVDELSRTREMGDLSENAGYQEAKGLVARLDGRIFSLKDRIKNAIIIESGADSQGRARIGATVTVRVRGKERMYEIVGSQETNPSGGRISHRSPLGSSLIGRAAGERVTIASAAGEIEYEILEVR
jgi:transcription elongation factor GreA